MAHLTIPSVIGYIWGVLALVWLAGLAFTKRTVHSQPAGSRLFHMALILLGFTLLGSPQFSAGWLGKNFLSPHAKACRSPGSFSPLAAVFSRSGHA